jgi:hypothetical protein
MHRRLITCCWLALLAATSLCHGADWFVATNGSGNGTLASPWSLQTAITNSSIHPGDTIWLRNGIYFPAATFFDGTLNIQGWEPLINGASNNLITFRSFSNEWAAIDRQWYVAPANYIRFRDLEFYDSLKGHNLTNSAYPDGPWGLFRVGGATGIEWVNCVIHDVDNALGGPTGSVRGCIFWYVGWNSLEHVCYPAPATFSGNISGWHMQNVINGNYDMNCVSNIMFGAGQPGGETSDDIMMFDLGTNVTIAWNYCYNRLTNTVSCVGLGLQGTACNLIVTSNIIVAPVPVMCAANVYSNVSFLGNTAYARSSNYAGTVLYRDQGVSGKWTIDYNHYFSTPPNSVWFNAVKNSYATLFAWQAGTGFDSNSTAANGTVPHDAVYVIPNQDQPKRCHIAIYNWSLMNNVTVNLTNILNPGDSYNLYSAQNLNGGVIQTGIFGTNTINYSVGMVPIQTGIFNGTNISVPMTNLTTAPILYGTNVNYSGEHIVQPPPTSPEFGAFVVIGTAGTNTVPLPPTDLHVLGQ